MTNRSLLIFAVLVPVFAVSTFAADIDHRTDKGVFVFEVKAEPAQPIVGSNSINLTIRDASTGATVDGASVRVVPYMTMHGHGSPKKTRVQEKGSGVYEVKDIYYSMEGPWDLLITIEKGNVEDSAGIKIVVK